MEHSMVEQIGSSCHPPSQASGWLVLRRTWYGFALTKSRFARRDACVKLIPCVIYKPLNCNPNHIGPQPVLRSSHVLDGGAPRLAHELDSL